MKEKPDLIQLVGNYLFMLLIFLFVADPTNTIFGLKNVAFVILVLYSAVFMKIEWSKLVYFLIPIIVVSISWVIALMQGEYVDLMVLKDLYFSFSPLLLLLWIKQYDVIRLAILPVTSVAIIVLLLFWLIFFYNEFEAPIFLFMTQHDETIMMSNRAFIGFKVFCMYPKSAVSFLPIFGFVLYKTFVGGKGRIMYAIISIVLLHLFLISGTRSSVLLPILLVGILILIYCRNGRYMRYLVYPGVLLFSIAFFVLLAILLMEEDEPSNLVKYAHLASYKKLFEANPEYLIFGQGPATEFYSEGFRGMAIRTEWTYIELIRNFGILCLPILYVIFLPMYKMLRVADKCDSALAIASSFFIYLIIAGTNPLLISSTGMLVLLSMYSFSEKMMTQAYEE